MSVVDVPKQDQDLDLDRPGHGQLIQMSDPPSRMYDLPGQPDHPSQVYNYPSQVQNHPSQVYNYPSQVQNHPSQVCNLPRHPGQLRNPPGRHRRPGRLYNPPGRHPGHLCNPPGHLEGPENLFDHTLLQCVILYSNKNCVDNCLPLIHPMQVH